MAAVDETELTNGTPLVSLMGSAAVPTSSATTSTSTSPFPSSADLKDLAISEAKVTTQLFNRRTSLEERSKVPRSIYLVAGCLFLFQLSCQFLSWEALQSYCQSVKNAALESRDYLAFLRDLCQSLYDGNSKRPVEYVWPFVITAIIASILYVFIVAPFRAGLWTGRRASNHKLHRYMGLAFLIQYTLACVEFASRYGSGAEISSLPQAIALNGLIQSTSAYFSFKMLPEAEDAGYYSDKAVLARNFVHENIYFSFMTFFGSLYYNARTREAMQSNLIGRILEAIFVFFPYVLIRPFFPITRFKNAGTRRKGRSDANQKFYEVATYMVKIFYLWAKYFCGFFVNFMVYLNLLSKENWKFVHGLFLLNAGTVSLAMFLHTLRFRKILPPRLTFTIYLGQIYATFTALPLAVDFFVSHPRVCAVVSTGLLCNLTRNLKIHIVWCCVAFYLLSQMNIEW